MELTYDELKAELLELQKQVAERAGRSSKSAEFKVSAKGGVSMYGLGRFPVTLYYEQWLKLLGRVDQLRAFLEANKGALKMKAAQPESS